MKNLGKFIAIILGCLSTIACVRDIPDDVLAVIDEIPEKIDFNFHIRPILSDRCFHCHGPDEKARKADLRLDLEKDAFNALASGNGYPIVAGNPGKSALIQRIFSDDPDYVMPTPESKLTLSEREKAIIFRWIEQGAEWKDHWAFLPIQNPKVPKVSLAARNPVDHFVAKKLEEQKLTFMPEADKERLLRRVTMDLTGLPPSIEALDAFLKDERPDAYEKVVDQLLDSKACAERLAMEWMDIARYADSHGMHADGYRFMWPWRDWVIEAFDNNMPYDDFVTWQLAGDLMDNSTFDQKLATAFHRNHPMTAEGGVVDEEFRLAYVFDRTETTATAFLGLTMNCARCHDHKFDPISQKDYYQMTAFFNNVKELGMTGDDGNYGPMLMMIDKPTQAKVTDLKNKLDLEEQALQKTKSELEETKAFLSQLDKKIERPKSVRKVHFNTLKNPKGKGGIIDGDNKYKASESLTLTEGRSGKAALFQDDYDVVSLDEVGDYEFTDPFSVSVWINTTKSKKDETQTVIGNAGGKNDFWRGWDLFLDTLNRPAFRIIHSLPHNYLHVLALDSISTNEWVHLGISYDGSGQAKGVKLFLNGKLLPTKIVFDQLYKSAYPIRGAVHTPYRKPLRIGKSYRGFTGENGIFRGKVDDLEIFDQQLTDLEMLQTSGVSEKDSERNGVKELYREHWLMKNAKVKKHQSNLRSIRAEILTTLDTVPEVMVMEEMAEPRPAFAYNRGEYDAPIYEVKANTPKVLPAFSESYPKSRLGLAKWLFSDDNPLTARVTVNRYWQMLFGRGIVNTPQDFGVQGSLPAHPELLDWLAYYLIEQDWDIKALLKVIVMSGTYRQSSKVSDQLNELDPENILLARGPSYRLQAEMIRDNALAASGLLVDKVGGASVRPYQPEGLWIEKGNFSHILLRYKESKGDSLYRRSLYTFVKRTSPHPAMTAFDAPNRDVCTVKREKTNTPLQSLVLLNDPQFVEAARVLAVRIQEEGGRAINDQINYAFRLVTGRHLKEPELQLFMELYDKQLQRFKADQEAAKKLLSVGQASFPEAFRLAETAALAMVSSTILNHDEAYMKR